MAEELHHPLIARALHWSWAVAMFLLGLSGMYVHNPEWMPFFNAIGSMTTARAIHFAFMYVVAFLVIGRIYYAFAGGDYKDLMVRPRDFIDMRLVAAYYVGLLKPKPDWGKYNPGQRIVYTGLVPILAIQAITGFALYSLPGFDWVASLFGSIAYVRLLHLLISWVFVSIVALHIYLSLLAGWGTFSSMFTGKQTNH